MIILPLIRLIANLRVVMLCLLRISLIRLKIIKCYIRFRLCIIRRRDVFLDM
jgi:hypothetical protein